jgi:hypothetical protein
MDHLNKDDSSLSVILKERNIDSVRCDIIDMMSQLGISCNLKPSSFTYNCVSFRNQEFIEFNVTICSVSNEEDKLLLGLKIDQLTGDRFKFGEILYDIGQFLSIAISGERKPSESDEIDLSSLDSVTEFMESLLSEEDAPELQIQGLQHLASCSSDLKNTSDTIVSNIFEATGKWNNLLKLVFKIIEEDKYDKLTLTAVSTLANIYELISNKSMTIDNELTKTAVEIAIKSMNNKDSEKYHLRREGGRLNESLK